MATGAASFSGCVSRLPTITGKTDPSVYLPEPAQANPVGESADLTIVYPANTTAEGVRYLIPLVRDALFYTPPEVMYGDISREIIGPGHVGIEGEFTQEVVVSELQEEGAVDIGVHQDFDLLTKRGLSFAVADQTVLIADRCDRDADKSHLRRLIQAQGTSGFAGELHNEFTDLMELLSTGLFTILTFDPEPLHGHHRWVHDDLDAWTETFYPVDGVGQTLEGVDGKIECRTVFRVEDPDQSHADEIRTRVIEQQGYGPIAYDAPDVSTRDDHILLTEKRGQRNVDFSK